jgi:hypothetical protein
LVQQDSHLQEESQGRALRRIKLTGRKSGGNDLIFLEVTTEEAKLLAECCRELLRENPGDLPGEAEEETEKDLRGMADVLTKLGDTPIPHGNYVESS